MDKRDIIGHIGEFTFYQRVIALTILFTNIPVAFSMMMMAFGGTIPDWTCSAPEDVDGAVNSNITNLCFVNGTFCNRRYLEDWRTVVTEWDLVCDKRWIGFMITSIQMAGVLCGSIITGYSADMFGRKTSFFASQLVLLLSNIIAIFSISWQMFAAVRFVIGAGVGGVLTVNFPLAMEFVGPRWRSILGAIPAFSGGSLLIPLFLFYVPDWRYYHVCNAVLCVIPLFGWFYIPESILWLTIKGKIDEAEEIIYHIAKKNNKDPPDTKILQTIYQEEAERRQKRSNYSYLDLIRTREMAKRTVILSVAWLSQSISFYCVSLGVQNLDGNLLLNMFLLTIVEMPSHLIVLVSANTLGRRWSVAGFYYAAGILGLGAAVASVYASDDYRGTIVNACAMLANLCVGTSWTIMMVFTTEQYPTVIRNIGYGGCNTLARIGAIFAAQVISLDGVGQYLPYVIITVLMAVSGTLILQLQETKGTVLEDSLKHNFSKLKESSPKTGRDYITEK